MSLAFAEVDARDGSLENRLDSLGSIRHIALRAKGAGRPSLRRSSAGLQVEGQVKTTCGRSGRDVFASFFLLVPSFPPSVIDRKTMTKIYVRREAKEWVGLI
jgi:hypothetical protein